MKSILDAIYAYMLCQCCPSYLPYLPYLEELEYVYFSTFCNGEGGSNFLKSRSRGK